MLRSFSTILSLFVAFNIFFSSTCDADETKVLKTKDTRTEAQKNFDANLESSQKVIERKQKEREAEQLRDKSHDNRLKVDENTSIGVQSDPPGMNIKKTFP